MAITETEALTLLPLATMKAELRIPDAPIVGPPPADPAAAAAAALAAAQAEANATAHDDLLSGQITAAWNFISEATGRGAGDLDNPALRSGAILLCRELYGGYREIKPNAAFYALIDPYRNLAGVFPSSPLVIVNPVTSDHTRYFGWSDKRVIETTEFAGASTASSNEGLLPQRATDGYIWFAVPEAAGYPATLHLNNGPIDQLSVFVRQAGTVDDANGDPHIVGVSFDIQSAGLSNEEIEIGY